MPSSIQRELALLVTGKDVSATRTLRGVDREVSKLERHLGKASRAVATNMERGVVIGATAAAGAIAYSVKQAVDWENAFAGVRKTLDATPEQLLAIEKGLRSMANEMPITAEQLAGIAEAGGQMGIASDDILEFTRTVALLSVTTNVSAEDAATALGQLGNSIKLRTQDYKGFAAALVDLGNKGNSTESQILEITKRAGGWARAAGINRRETLGWAAAVANIFGDNQEAGGTAMAKFMREMTRSFSTGSKKLQAITGKTRDELVGMFKKDATGAMEFFLRKIAGLKGKNRLEAIEAIFGKGANIGKLVNDLAANIDNNLTPSLANANKAWAEGTAAQAEYEKRAQTTASQLQILRNNIDNAAVTIGTALLPMVNELAKEGVDWLQGHEAEIAQFAKDLAAGLKDAVTWARSLDWDTITASLRAGADAAKLIITAFTSAPPWLQEFLAAGFVANKFTGGVIGDVIGDVFKGALKGALGIQAGVVNVRGGVVNGGGVGAGAGGGMGKLGKVALGAEAIGGLVAVVATQQEVSAMNSQIASDIHQSLSSGLAVKTPEELRTALAAVETGINDLQANPLNVLVQGSALDELRGMRSELKARIEKDQTRTEFRQGERDSWNQGVKPGSTAQGQQGMAGWAAGRDAWSKPIGDLKRDAVAAVTEVKGSTDKLGPLGQQGIIATDRVRSATATGAQNVASATRSGAAGTTAATNSGATRIVGAINRIPAPITNVHVNVTAASVQTQVTQSQRSGNPTGSHGSGHNQANRYD